VLRRTLVVGLAAVALGLTACGDDNNDSGDTGAAAATTPAATEPGTATDSGAGARLQIAADPGGDLAFDKTSLSAAAGEVEIDFDNQSQIPHNVAIEAAGERDIGSTDTITGSSTSKTFNLDAGSYTYYCSVGSHRQAGMEGTLTVR
jgi:plastocyanin